VRNLTTDPKYNSNNAIPFAFNEGDFVIKDTGDYLFDGIVMCRFRKRSGTPRYVVENEAGIVHVFNHTQLKLNNKDEDNALPC
jgi:hypothetical protein